MKRIITLFVFLTTTFFYAQNSGITYQAVIYNPSGEILPGNNNSNAVLSNKDICLRFSITDAQTSLEYQETQKVKTDEFGMVNLLIGLGNQEGGYASNFNAIVWDSSSKKLQVAIDVTGTCVNFIEVSNQNFSAVPFAYASKIADGVSGIVPIIHGGTGANTVTGAKTNLGLNNVDNTSDANKQISIATQAALNDKAPLASPTLTGVPMAPTAATGTNTNQIATTAFVTSSILSASTPDATLTTKGKIKLAGDLGGTADLPTVPGLATKENTIVAGTTTQYYRGDKTWQILDKTTVGLSNVDNTSDASKPISTDTQIALNAKENASNKSSTTTLGTSDVLYPTQNAVKTYVDTQITTNATPNATTTSLGKIQLTGDLGGTATNPTVPGLALKEPLITAGATTQYYRGDKTWQILDKTTVGLSNVDNTSDASKPISTATQTALNLKANLASPTFTGDATAVTATTGDNDTSIATTAFVSAALTNAATPDADSITKGKLQLAGDLAGTNSSASNPVITNGAIITQKLADNAVTNAKIGEIITVNKGGTGSDMSSLGPGYIKQASNGANFTTVSSIPVADISGAVRSVNGVLPATNGNVSVIIGQVTTGTNSDPTQVVASPNNSDIYVIAGQTGTPNDNGRTFINDGTTWHEISTNVAALDNTFVKLSGSTMAGNLVLNSGNKITIADAPTASTDVANKDYVDTKIGGSGTTNFVPKFSAVKTLSDSSIFDNGNVGIGTTTPANKLEIAQGTAGNSGLRFTNLNSSSAATTSASKVLGVNSTGDVILTNIPGTQNIVSFSTADPNTGSPVFTPNTLADQTVIYQSAIDNSLWTYNGTTYVTYTAPTSTAWNLANTTNDAGSNKTTAIYRTGSVGIGTGTSTPAGVLNVFGSTAGNSGLTGAGSLVWLKQNSAWGVTAPYALWVDGYSYLNGFRISGTDGQRAIYNQIANTELGFGSNGGDITFSYNNGLTRGLVIKNTTGNLGIGTISPISLLSNAPTGTNFVSSNSAIQSTTGISWLTNNAGYNTSLYNSNNVVGSNGLQVKVANNSNQTYALEVGQNTTQTGMSTPLFNVLGNGYIGVGTNAPVSSFANTVTAIQGSNSTNAFNGGLTWTTPGTGFAGSFYSQPSNGNGLQVKIAGTSSSNNALEISTGATQSGTTTPLFNVLGNGNVGVGTSSPITRLIVNDNAYIANIPSSSTNLMDNSTFRPLTRFQTTSGINNNAISHYLTTAMGATQAHNYSTGAVLPYTLQPVGGNVGIGLGNTAPTAQLHTNGTVRFAGAGTPGVGKVLTSDASGNATWQSTIVSTQTAAYTLAATDYGSVIVINSATTIDLTIPSTLTAGFYCQIIQQGAGQVNVVGSNGVTVTSALGTLSRTIGSSIGIMLTSATTAFLSGDTSF